MFESFAEASLRPSFTKKSTRPNLLTCLSTFHTLLSGLWKPIQQRPSLFLPRASHNRHQWQRPLGIGAPKQVVSTTSKSDHELPECRPDEVPCSCLSAAGCTALSAERQCWKRNWRCSACLGNLCRVICTFGEIYNLGGESLRWMWVKRHEA